MHLVICLAQNNNWAHAISKLIDNWVKIKQSSLQYSKITDIVLVCIPPVFHDFGGSETIRQPVTEKMSFVSIAPSDYE